MRISAESSISTTNLKTLPFRMSFQSQTQQCVFLFVIKLSKSVKILTWSHFRLFKGLIGLNELKSNWISADKISLLFIILKVYSLWLQDFTFTFTVSIISRESFYLKKVSLHHCLQTWNFYRWWGWPKLFSKSMWCFWKELWERKLGLSSKRKR